MLQAQQEDARRPLAPRRPQLIRSAVFVSPQGLHSRFSPLACARVRKTRRRLVPVSFLVRFLPQP